MTQQNFAISSLDDLMNKYQFKTSPTCCFIEINGQCYGWPELPANVDPACVISVSISDADSDDDDNENFDVYCFANGIGRVNVMGYLISETPITHDVLIED